MMWENLVWFCLLMLGLMSLGHCAALKGEGKPDSVDVLNVNMHGRLVVGKGGGEKPEAKKAWDGKLIIGLNGSVPEDLHDIPESLKSGSESLSDSDYQSDQADWSELQYLQGSVYSFGGYNSPAVQQLLGMRPKVDCDEDAMQLKVNGRLSDFRFNLLIDRGRVPPLPLSRIPSECGIHVQATWRGLVLTVPYDGCYVAQERDAYTLPLRLWGLPARMSCPLLNLAPSPPSVACYPNGMIVKTHNIAPVEDLWVKVENEWQPLLKASPECGYSMVSHSDGVVVSAPYKPCMEAKDGLYSLHMSARSEFKLFCPSLVPSLPLNLSRLVSSDQSGSADTSAPTMGTSVDASPVPSKQLSTWPWFGHPQTRHPLMPGPTPKQPGVPYKFSQRDPQLTHVPVLPSTPQETQHILDPQFPNTWYPVNFEEPPFGEPPAPPAFPQKPKPLPATHTSTSRTTPSPQSKPFDLVGSPPKIREQPTWQQPGAVPMSVSHPVEHPRYVFAQGPPWPHQPQYPDRLTVSPPAESVEASSVLKQTGLYEVHPQILPGSLYPPEYPQRPAVFPTESFEMSSIFEATDSRQAAPQMHAGLGFDQGPALFPTAAPSKPLEASSVLGEADSPYQAVPHMSKPLGYSGCCPSPALYSSCCPPSLSYHQHNHLHFGLAYPAFQSAATLWSTKNVTSRASSHSRHSGSAPQPVTSQATGDYGRHFGALLLREVIQQRGKPSEGLFLSSRPHDWPVKPIERPQTVPNSAVPSTKRPWTGLEPSLFSSLHKPLRVGAPGYFRSSYHEPKPGSPTNIGENGLQQSARLAPNRMHPPPVPTSGQTNAESFMFPSREHYSQPNYSDLDDSLSKHFHDESDGYFSQGKVPSVVAVPQNFATKPEPQKQDPVFPKLKPSFFQQIPGSESPIQLDAHSQEQVPSVPGGFPNIPSHDHATEDSYMLHLQAVKRLLSQHWISVVPPKQTKVFDPLDGLPPSGYQPHGPV
ncbi:hypothetical protein MHYP_G00001050 [Metynnis hypsauchen]